MCFIGVSRAHLSAKSLGPHTHTNKHPRYTSTVPGTPLRKYGRLIFPDTAFIGELE